LGSIVASRKLNLTDEDIAALFAGKPGEAFAPILSPTKFAQLLGRSRKTIDHWLALGRLDGAFRKRGKHVFILRDKALSILFNGKEWTS
jgi:hypothetical protein